MWGGNTCEGEIQGVAAWSLVIVTGISLSLLIGGKLSGYCYQLNYFGGLWIRAKCSVDNF